MTHIIVGLGNPGDEYEGTRHNTGRMMLFDFAKSLGKDGKLGKDSRAGSVAGSVGSTDDFSSDKKIKALVAKGEVGSGKKKEKIMLIAPETFMNNSGKAVGPLVTSPKAAEKLIVIYDDFNLPLGSIRISWNRSAGGHNGLASIIKSVKTEAFVRIRVGTAPVRADGTAKTPHGDKEIEKFILSTYKPAELSELKKVSKRVSGAIAAVITEGRDKAMSVYNAGL